MSGHGRDALGVKGGNRHFDTVLMGRSTSKTSALRWASRARIRILGGTFFSKTMTASPNPQVQLVSTDPADLVRALKHEAGLDIWLCGGASLAGALYREVDELILKVNPVVLGTGIPLFRGVRGPANLELVDHKTFAGGVTINRYRAAK